MILPMVRSDPLGNPVTGDEDSTRAAVDDFVLGLLAYETRAAGILEAAERDPDSCLANVYAGFLCLLLESAEGAARATRYLRAAERRESGATARERLNVALLRAWAGDDLASALAACERLSDDHPRDLVAVKLHQYLEFNRGNAPEMLRVALKVGEANGDVAYLHGMTAFAYEQCHLLDAAEAAARRALALSAKEPWAQHALAHVLLTRGRIDEGAAFLERQRDTWTDLSSFMLTHLWWHLALFYLSQGRDARVLDVYDRQVWGVAKDYSQDQVGAVSLLARLELAGIDVGDRWRELGEYLAARAVDTVQPFLTLQYVYGLARAGRPEATTLLAAVRRHALEAPPLTRGVWRDVALPACTGLAAHARHDHETAWRELSAAMPRLAEVGGSHAQRDLFEQVLLDAAAKTGRWIFVQQQLELRRAGDHDGVPVNLALADAYDQLRLPGLAAAARARAAATRAAHTT